MVPLPKLDRVVIGLSGAALMVPLVIAAWIQPDPRGFGTHEQLGLPPCTFRLWLGARCPSCGMTTSWSYLIRGRVQEATRASVGGAMLFAAAALGGPWMLLSAISGRWFVVEPDDRLVMYGLVAFVVVALVEWLVRLTWP